MKTFIYTFLLTMHFFAVVAQDGSKSTSHLSFKGVPIDGKLNDFITKMKEKGFVYIEVKKGVGFLRGEFAGHKNCVIEPVSLDNKDLVYKVNVSFTSKSTWSQLSENYYDLKQMLTEKYGKPSEVSEVFDNYSEPSDDNARMYEVKLDRCKYFSIFEMDNGKILLSIDHDGLRRCFVRLVYFDKINSDISRAKAKGDL